MRSVDVVVEGMTCGSCVRRVQSALARVDGVVVERIDRAGARVAVDEALASEDDLVRAVEQAGYAARIARAA